MTLRSPLPRLFRLIGFCGFASLCAVAGRAQQTDDAIRSFSVDERVDGSSSSFGQILKLNTNFGYEAGRHVGIDIGAPVYFVRTSPSDPLTSPGSKTGLGNAYVSLRLSFSGVLNYTSTVTGTAPTGSRAKGLSTGHATVDWNNSIQKVIAHRIAPYTNVGIASTVSDTPFFVRPFSSSGLIGHGEAGMTLSISQHLYFGGSAYAIVPSGKQTIVSKVVQVQTISQTGPTLPANSHGHGAGLTKSRPDLVLETVSDVITTSDLVSDRGASMWTGIGPLRSVNLTLGYSHSNRYALNTVFWGISKRFGTFGLLR